MPINVIPDALTQSNDVFESTSVNIPRPTGVSVGMLLILGITFADTQTSPTSVSIAGWTQFGSTGVGADKFAFYRIADSSDTSGGNWVCTCQNGFIEQWAIAGWNGVNPTTPFAAGPVINSNTTTTFSFSSLTSPGVGSVWAGISLVATNSTSQTDPTPPPTDQIQSTSPYYFGPATIFSAEVDSGAFAPSGTIGAAFEWATVAMFLNPSGSSPAATLPIPRWFGIMP